MKSILKSIMFFVSCFILGIVLGLMIDLSSVTWGLALVGLVIGYPLGVIIHEMGHLIFGLLTGYQFVSFRIFHFMLYKENGKLRHGRMSVEGTLGQCLMKPGKHQSFVLYHMGGILFNLLAAILCLMMSNDIFSGMGIMNLFMFICNALPMKGNDGSNVLDLLIHKNDRPYFFNQMHIVSLQTENIRFKDMPRDYFYFDQEDLHLVFGNASAVMCEGLYMDLKEYSKAEALVDVLVNHPDTHPIYKKMLMCDKIYFNFKNHREEDSKRYLTPDFKKFLQAMKNEPTCLRTQYLLGWIDEKTMLAGFEHYPYKQEVERELELLEELNYGTCDHC